MTQANQQQPSEQEVAKARREGLCEDCGREYPCPWFASNYVWNAVIEGSTCLCPSCFITRAEKSKFPNTSWELRPEMLGPAPPAEWLARYISQQSGGRIEDARRVIADGWWQRELGLIGAYAAAQSTDQKALIAELVKGLEEFGDCRPTCATNAPREDAGHLGCTCGRVKLLAHAKESL